MLENNEQPTSFEREATEVLQGLKQSFAGVLASLGVRRPVELQRLFKLDAKLCWQIFKAAQERDVLAAGSVIPARVSIERFASAASSHVGAEQISSLTSAYDRFESLVQKHAGDRTSFSSLITAAAGLNEEWLAADQQHRRNLFRGFSHVMGVHAQARLFSFMLTKDPEPGVYGSVAISGYVGLRVLRAMDAVRVHGMQQIPEVPNNESNFLEHKPIGLRGENYLLEDFCTHPLPKLQLTTGQTGMENWVHTSLVRPEVGNVGLATVMFGEKWRLRQLPSQLRYLTSIPIEILIQDVLIQPGLMEGPPNLSVFLGNDNFPSRPPDHMPLMGDHKIEFLGKGADVLATPEMPRYPEMATAIAQKLGWNINTFEVWRVRLEYPVYQSTSSIHLHFTKDAVNALEETK